MIIKSEIEEGKYIMFVEKNICGKDVRIFKSYENLVPKSSLKIFKLFLYLIIDKSFRWKFIETIKYALKHYDSYRGSGSSNVLLFLGEKKAHKIWKKR